MYNYKNPSTSMEDEFLRPNPAPPLPYSQSPSLKYQQNIFPNVPSHSPRFDNFHSNYSSINETISKSVMFGIPRNTYPKPSDVRAPVGVDFHPANLGSPFVDITLLNNCDDLSLYQPHQIQQQTVQHRPQMTPQVTPQLTPQSRPALVRPQNINPMPNHQPTYQMVQPSVKNEFSRASVQNTSQVEPKPILKKLPEQNWTPHGIYNQSLYKDGSMFKIDDNLDADEEEEEEDESDSEDEGENIFSAALKNLKEKNKDWSLSDQQALNQQSNHQKLLKFEYKSLMLDDLDSFPLNNNMSMNTKALAAKYLNKKEITDNLNSQSLFLPKLETGNLFKMYEHKESMMQDTRVFKSNSSSNNSESDEDIWLFGKPTDNTDKADKKKHVKKKAQKDFSDQDSDVDRDVTNVLDIEKLKLLPKLL